MSTGEWSAKPITRTEEQINYIINNFEYRNDKLFWKNGPRIGRPVGIQINDGYQSCKLNFKDKRVAVKIHHIVWFLSKGKWPETEIDHVNGIRNDNRIENLRETSRSKNRHNIKTSKCYWWKPKNKKYEACVKYKNEKHYLGLFSTEEEARIAVEEKSKEIYGSYSKCYDTNKELT